MPFEEALDESMDLIRVSICPVLYAPVGEPGLFNRTFIAFPTGIPIIRTRIERFQPGPYDVYLTVERDKRALVKDLGDVLGCALETVKDVAFPK